LIILGAGMTVKQVVPEKIIKKLDVVKVGQSIKFGVGKITVKKFCAGDNCEKLCFFSKNRDICKQVDCVRENEDAGVYFEYTGK
jgi:hypothetical protein